jgi:hypothetical protein
MTDLLKEKDAMIHALRLELAIKNEEIEKINFTKNKALRFLKTLVYQLENN